MDEWLEQIAAKYGYNQELKNAISLTIPLMIKKYGEERKQEVFDLFENTRIFTTNDMSKDHRDEIEKEMIGNINSHLLQEDTDPYQTGNDPASYYSYQAVYDEDMNITGEVRWIVVKDMAGSYQEEAYRNLFGTSINMPYFIHEVGHAFGMQNPTYQKDGNTIYTKHGMYEQTYTYEQKDGKMKLETIKTDNILLEEIVNEKDTQDMLTDMMNVANYQEVEKKLGEIHHVESNYSTILIALASKLEKELGMENLLKFRKDNQKEIIQEFNRVVAQSDIAKKYFPNEEGYAYLANIAFELFQLSANAPKMSMDDYKLETSKLMVDGYKPLCAHSGMSLDRFDEIKKDILGEELENQNENDFNSSK